MSDEVTLTKAELQKLMQQAASAAVQQTQASDRMTQALGGQTPPRVSVRNWKRSQLKWEALTADEKETILIRQALVADAMDDINPIRMAKGIVKTARRTGATIDTEILALSRQDPEQFNTAKIEILAKQAHIGDGQKGYKGQTLMCHPKLAEVLVDAGAARLIEEDSDADAENARVATVHRLSRTG